MPTEVKSKRPPTPRQKTVKLADLNKKVDKLNKLTTYPINTETNEVVKYYEVFDELKIQDLLVELNTHMQYDKDNNIGYFENDQKIIEYLSYLIVKFFSHFYDEIGSEFENNIAAFDTLTRLGLFHKFHSEIFNPEQVAKVFDRFYERIEALSKVIELDPKTQQQLANLQNKDIIFNKSKIIPEV